MKYFPVFHKGHSPKLNTENYFMPLAHHTGSIWALKYVPYRIILKLREPVCTHCRFQSPYTVLYWNTILYCNGTLHCLYCTGTHCTVPNVSQSITIAVISKVKSYLSTYLLTRQKYKLNIVCLDNYLFLSSLK